MAYLFLMLFSLLIAGVAADWDDEKPDDNNSL